MIFFLKKVITLLILDAKIYLYQENLCKANPDRRSIFYLVYHNLFPSSLNLLPNTLYGFLSTLIFSQASY